MINSTKLPIISRLCDYPTCYRGAVGVVKRDGKNMAVFAEHKDAPKKMQQKNIFSLD